MQVFKENVKFIKILLNYFRKRNYAFAETPKSKAREAPLLIKNPAFKTG